MALLGNHGQDALQIGHEAHVEHAVRFVEHDHLHAFERQVATFEVVDEPARAGDHDVDAALERAFLDRHVDAAERGADVQAREGRVLAEVLGDLHAEFARGNDDEAAEPGLAARQHVQHRQAERGRLAAARLAEADEVLTAEDLGNGLRLDVGGLLVADRAHAAEDGLTEPEGCKRH